MKYIIIEHSSGMEVPIVFCDIIQHSDAIPSGGKAVSAGFCTIEEIYSDVKCKKILKASCYGASISLNLSMREEDSDIVTCGLNFRS